MGALIGVSYRSDQIQQFLEREFEEQNFVVLCSHDDLYILAFVQTG